MNPDPITTTGLVDIGSSIWSGAKTDVPVAKEGILNLTDGGPASNFSRLPATGATLIKMTNSIYFGGNVNGLIVAGGANSISDNIGAVYCSIIVGNQNTVNGGSNQNIVAGSAHTVNGSSYYNLVAGSYALLTNALSNVVAGATSGAGRNTLNNVTSSLVGGIAHNLSGGSDDLIVGGYNSIVTNSDNSLASGGQNTITNQSR